MSVFMQPIYTQTVGSGGAAVIAFNNIPQGFTDLKLVMSLRSTATGSLTGGFADGSYVAVNNDLTNVSWTFMYASTTTTNTSRGTNSIPYLGPINGAGTTASTFSSCEVYFADYTNAFSKQMKVDVAAENNSASNYFVSNLAILHGRNNPITSLQVYSGEGSWAQHSTVTLYGISERFDTEIPTAPAIGTVTDQAGFASVAFTPGSNDRVDNYVVTSTPSNSTTYGTSSPISTPAVLGTSYTYKVSSVNSLGATESASSTSLTTSNSYSSIASYVFPSSALNTITFTNIPQYYKHLQIRIIARSTRTFSGNALDVLSMRVNGDYQTASHYLFGNSSSVGSNYQPGWNAGLIVSASSSTLATNANVFSPVVIDIYNYSNTTMYKTARSTFGIEANLAYSDAAYEGIGGLMFPQFAPVTLLQFDCSNANFAQNTMVAIYGIGG